MTTRRTAVLDSTRLTIEAIIDGRLREIADLGHVTSRRQATRRLSEHGFAVAGSWYTTADGCSIRKVTS